MREVGTLTHKLPTGVVMNKKDRELAARIWKVPVERIPAASIPSPSDRSLTRWNQHLPRLLNPRCAPPGSVRP